MEEVPYVKVSNAQEAFMLTLLQRQDEILQSLAKLQDACSQVKQGPQRIEDLDTSVLLRPTSIEEESTSIAQHLNKHTVHGCQYTYIRVQHPENMEKLRKAGLRLTKLQYQEHRYEIDWTTLK